MRAIGLQALYYDPAEPQTRDYARKTMATAFLPPGEVVHAVQALQVQAPDWFHASRTSITTSMVKWAISQRIFFSSTLQPPLQNGYSNIAQDVRDVLINPPATDPYTTLKQKLISHMTELEQRRVQMLLTEEELGDRKTISAIKAHGATRGRTTTRQSHTQTVVLTASATKCTLNSCFKKRFPVIVGSR